MATETVWQFSSGCRRSETVFEEEALYNAFYPLVEFDGDHLEDGMVRLAMEGSHRIIFLNPRALDYVSMPTHLFEEGSSIATADELDELEAAEAREGSSRRLVARRSRAQR